MEDGRQKEGILIGNVASREHMVLRRSSGHRADSDHTGYLREKETEYVLSERIHDYKQ